MYFILGKAVSLYSVLYFRCFNFWMCISFFKKQILLTYLRAYIRMHFIKHSFSIVVFNIVQLHRLVEIISLITLSLKKDFSVFSVILYKSHE